MSASMYESPRPLAPALQAKLRRIEIAVAKKQRIQRIRIALQNIVELAVLPLLVAPPGQRVIAAGPPRDSSSLRSSSAKRLSASSCRRSASSAIAASRTSLSANGRRSPLASAPRTSPMNARSRALTPAMDTSTTFATSAGWPISSFPSPLALIGSFLRSVYSRRDALAIGEPSNSLVTTTPLQLRARVPRARQAAGRSSSP